MRDYIAFIIAFAFMAVAYYGVFHYSDNGEKRKARAMVDVLFMVSVLCLLAAAAVQPDAKTWEIREINGNIIKVENDRGQTRRLKSDKVCHEKCEYEVGDEIIVITTVYATTYFGPADQIATVNDSD